MPFLSFRARRRRQVVLYSREGCHLCEEVRGALERLEGKYRLDIEEIDITADPALVRRYDVRIPVVVIDGSVELEAPISERDLRQALR